MTTEDDRRDELVLWPSAALMLFNSSGSVWSVVVAAATLLALAKPLKLARRPLLWALSALAWAPVLVLDWIRIEDHVYFGAYWLLALALALRSSDFWSTARFHAKTLVGLVFAIAVVWKVSAPEFVDGRTFEFLLLTDQRFSSLARLSGLSAAEVEHNHTAWLALVSANGPNEAVFAPLRGEHTRALAIAMTLWTLALESLLAAVFLAPDDSRLARLRHPALITFCATTYPVTPVLGFGFAFCVCGLTIAESRRQRAWVRAYCLVLLLLAVAFLLRVYFD